MLSSHHKNMATSIEDRLRDPNSSSMAIPPVASTAPTSSSSSSVHPTNIRELLWEERAKTLRDLLSNYRLPLAVKLKSGDISSFLTSSHHTHGGITNENGLSHSAIRASPTKLSSGVDSRTDPTGASNTIIKAKGTRDEEVVLQIHETRRKKIILARKMTWEKRQNDYVVTGEQVEIPASFKGWLEVVPDDGRPVEYFDTVGGITSVKPKRFLVRTSTVGYQLTTEDNGNSCWMPTEIKPGEVLTTGIVYMDNKRGSGSGRSATQRNIFKRLLKQSKPKKEQELKYLQCFDVSGQEIMIPLIMSGVFSPVGDASMANYDAVYELQDLIMAFGLPVNAQLIHVNGREKFPCPRGVIRLYGTREEELAVVSKVGPDGALNYKTKTSSENDTTPSSPDTGSDGNTERFEIPLDKEALFRRGVVKKKPSIKANLVDVFKPLPERDKIKSSQTGGEALGKGRGYFRTQSYDEFKLRGANDKKLSIPLSTRAKPVVSTYNDKPVYSDKDEEKTPIVHGSASQPASPFKSSPIDQSSISVIGIREKMPEQPVSKEVELPEKAPKELKKSKSTGLLDKLSVRRAKKERAKLKELKGDDVFSRRISKSDVNYQDFFNGLSDNEDSGTSKSKDKNKEADSETKPSSGQSSGSQPTTPNKVYGKAQDGCVTKPSSDSSVGDNKSLTLAQRRHSNMQNRDLPPIPPESPVHEPAASPNHHMNISKESLYEHLPPAPPTPASRRSYQNNNNNISSYKSSSYTQQQQHNNQNYNHKHFDDGEEDDGYMTPMQFRQEPAIQYGASSPVQMRGKPGPALHDSLRSSRSRRVRSELPQEFIHRHKTYDDDCPLDIDDLFSFAYGSKTLGDPRPLHTLSSHPAVSTSQLYGAAKVPAWRSDVPPGLDHRFMDNLDLENHGGHMRSRQAVRNMNINPNATIRSHNLRKSRPSAMEVFHFTDSFRDIREPPEQNIEAPVSDFHNNHPQNFYDHQTFYPPASAPRPPLLISRSMDASPAPSFYHHHHPHPQQDIYGHPYGAGVAHYAESEPCYRPSHKAASLGGTSENFPRPYGDDSMCSRGDGGFPNESEYSYNEYMEQVKDDDGWTPPDSVEGMSVLEVSKSLRYIGMKDRVVLRFSNEQIDGSMLCTLDKKHLKEGFPELNALELKKILDFVQGWRPKKK
ncbi:GRB2-associated and regulator of MAPK protein [Elysia marginata]|uniref:GRB2-associated and regulator of MAPK protein n=1 Tax=Elysia marginata TaxID=1093978 RepID=A0AAV4J4T6_9GAST|nr:GRB2-associated and regulator of MAPK protein [Elysia marginata]